MRKTKLRRVSKKRQEELAIYTKKRAEMLPGTYCEVPNCGYPADDIHHIRGRWGKRLNDERYFMLVCRPHHRWITDHGKQAREFGWIDT